MTCLGRRAGPHLGGMARWLRVCTAQTSWVFSRDPDFLVLARLVLKRSSAEGAGCGTKKTGSEVVEEEQGTVWSLGTGSWTTKCACFLGTLASSLILCTCSKGHTPTVNMLLVCFPSPVSLTK